MRVWNHFDYCGLYEHNSPLLGVVTNLFDDCDTLARSTLTASRYFCCCLRCPHKWNKTEIKLKLNGVLYQSSHVWHRKTDTQKQPRNVFAVLFLFCFCFISVLLQMCGHYNRRLALDCVVNEGVRREIRVNWFLCVSTSICCSNSQRFVAVRERERERERERAYILINIEIIFCRILHLRTVFAFVDTVSLTFIALSHLQHSSYGSLRFYDGRQGRPKAPQATQYASRKSSGGGQK